MPDIDLTIDIGTSAVEVVTEPDFEVEVGLIDMPSVEVGVPGPPGIPGPGVDVWEQPDEPLPAKEGDIWIDTDALPPSSGGGAGGAATWVHHQIAAAATWTILHPLNQNRYPVILLDDNPTVQVVTDVFYPDLSTVVLEFPSPVSGYAYL